MRWKEVILGLVLALAASAGCRQQCFTDMPDGKDYLNELHLPPHLETNPEVAVVPQGGDVPKPPTVIDPEREARYITLAEAIAAALENGRTGVENSRLPGVIDDSLPAFQGTNVSLADNIRALALDPAIFGTNIEASLSKFDARWTTSMTWQKTDEPLGGNFFNSFNNGDQASFNTQLLKPLPTGGVAGITFNTNYTFLTAPPQGVTNPAYRPRLQFQFEQPLLQGFGVEINELRTNHPGSLLTPFNNNSRVAGILLTRINFDEARADFERHVSFLLVNVETAYWNLYGSYWTLYSREQGLRQAYAAWRINRDRLEAGRVSRQDLAETREQYELFRGQRIAALDQVMENERQLRGLMGLPVEDGHRLVPADQPTLAFYQPDWTTSLNEALALRPELVLVRDDLKFRQLDLINQKNLLLPDLRSFATYNINSIGTHLDGGSGDPNNAFATLAANDFHDWQIGLRLEVPIGFRDASSAVRAARLRLAQTYISLRDEENRAQSFLAQQYRLLSTSYETIRATRAQREAAAVALESRLREYLAGKIILDVLLRAQQDWADALRTEYAAIVQYNNALASFEFAKGTILQHDNVVIAEGPLPHCVQVRAVEHERQRAKALVLEERANPVIHPPCCYEQGHAGLPELPTFAAPSIPALYQNAGPVQEISSKEAPAGPAPVSPEQAPQAPGQRPDSAAALPAAAPAVKPAASLQSADVWGSMGASPRPATLPESLEELPTLKTAPAGGAAPAPPEALQSLPALPVHGPDSAGAGAEAGPGSEAGPVGLLPTLPGAGPAGPGTPPNRAGLAWSGS